MSGRGSSQAETAARFFCGLTETYRGSARQTEDRARLVTQALKLCFAVVERAEIPHDVAARTALRVVAEFAKGAMTQGDFVGAAEEAAVLELENGPRAHGARLLLLRAFAEWALADGVEEEAVHREVERELGESLYGQFPQRGEAES